jgi:microcompartment protein CcmL/EutN
MGIVESFNVATMVEAAVKSADVRIVELPLAMAFGWKTFDVLGGDVAAVQAGVVAARRVVSEAGVLVTSVIISRPDTDVYRRSSDRTRRCNHGDTSVHHYSVAPSRVKRTLRAS